MVITSLCSVSEKHTHGNMQINKKTDQLIDYGTTDLMIRATVQIIKNFWLTFTPTWLRADINC